MADNPLTKLSLLGQLAVAVVVSLVLGGLFYYFYWSDAVAQEESKKSVKAKLEDEIRALEVIRNKQQEFLREVEARKAKLELLKRILPADKETPELMKKVQYLATQQNLQIRKFNPGATVTRQFETPAAAARPGQPAQPAARPAPAPAQPPRPGQPPAAAAAANAPRDAYQEWPINVDMEGSYHNLGMFLDKVSRLSRLVNVGTMKIKSQTTPKPGNTILVSCVATTYVYVEARPQPAPAPPTPTKGQPQ